MVSKGASNSLSVPISAFGAVVGLHDARADSERNGLVAQRVSTDAVCPTVGKHLVEPLLHHGRAVEPVQGKLQDERVMRIHEAALSSGVDLAVRVRLGEHMHIA